VTYAGITFEQWNDEPDDAAGRTAQEIADRYDLSVVGPKDAVYVGRSHRVALFYRNGCGSLSIQVPADDWLRRGSLPACCGPGASYAESASEWCLAPLAEFVDAMTSPASSVEIPAMLVAVEALDPCEIPQTPDDSRLPEVVAAGARRGGMQVFRSGGGVEVEFDRAGQVTRVCATREVSHGEVLAGLAGNGLLTITPDEWQWACGAGAATLFRWGDDSPDDGYPSDCQTGPHRETNLWGLAIGQDPYTHEVTTEGTVVCGGDGGSTTCGGSGFLLAWLTLATAHRDKEFGQWLASDDGYDESLTRPVIELS
jgi:hypothetical protein